MLNICNNKDIILSILININSAYWIIFIPIYIYNIRTVKNIEIENYILKEIGELTNLEEL